VVESGLVEGEEIATNGVFKIDAAAQLQGLTSMMNPEGGAGSKVHDHGGMEMGDSNKDADHAMFTVAGNCGMCKDRIEAAAASVDGVISANWDAESQMIHLNMEKGTSVNIIHKAIAQAGHDTKLEKAPDNVYNDLPGCCLFERLQYSDKEKSPEQSVSFTVAGNCGMCKDRIETVALSVDGVTFAEWNTDSKKIQLKYDDNKTNIEAIHKAIAAVGHDTEKIKAPDDVYNELHECCLYERINY
jgi:Cu(I)/Ag(I) efflux system membrane fusion protein